MWKPNWASDSRHNLSYLKLSNGAVRFECVLGNLLFTQPFSFYIAIYSTIVSSQVFLWCFSISFQFLSGYAKLRTSWKFLPILMKFIVCNPRQSFLALTIIVPFVLFLRIFVFVRYRKYWKKKSSQENHLTIGSYVSVHSSRYEARGKFGEHERCVRVARGVAESNSSFLSALQTSQVLHISMNAQLTYESIVL